MSEVQFQNPNYVMSFFMADINNSAKGVPGLNPLPRPRVAKNGGTFVAAMGQVVDQGYGWYGLLGHPQDRNMLGTLLVGGDVDDPDVICVEGQHEVKDYDPYAALNSESTELSALLTIAQQILSLKQQSNAYDKALTNSTVPKPEKFT